MALRLCLAVVAILVVFAVAVVLLYVQPPESMERIDALHLSDKLSAYGALTASAAGVAVLVIVLLSLARALRLVHWRWAKLSSLWVPAILFLLAALVGGAGPSIVDYASNRATSQLRHRELADLFRKARTLSQSTFEPSSEQELPKSEWEVKVSDDKLYQIGEHGHYLFMEVRNPVNQTEFLARIEVLHTSRPLDREMDFASDRFSVLGALPAQAGELYPDHQAQIMSACQPIYRDLANDIYKVKGVQKPEQSSYLICSLVIEDAAEVDWTQFCTVLNKALKRLLDVIRPIVPELQNDK